MATDHPIVGFTAGVYDLFHVGHLNLLEAAHERCDFLRVGVISDELCEVLKLKTPVIPFEERIRIVAALRCVDEAVPIREERLLFKVEAFYEWGFDIAFSGDDHADEQSWRREEQILSDLGAKIVYLPYTKEISTSMLRKRLGV